jgi:isopenicillin-N epimerase
MTDREVHPSSATLRQHWDLRPGVTYLNHGSFGPAPRPVREAWRQWGDQLQSEPVDFFVRILPEALEQARGVLAAFVGTRPQNVALVDNATAGMNVVAQSVHLSAGDEVLITDHDYGAVIRIWQRACDRAGASLIVQNVPTPVVGVEELVDRVLQGVTPRTRLLVFSHVTSPTAIVFPAEALCRAARQRGLLVCIDGPHALAMRDLNLDQLDCDYYTASCHKWLCAPFGSGFLYVHPRQQEFVQPAVLSWGRHPPLKQELSWLDEFIWPGTRDPSPWLAVPAAIEFLTQHVGLDFFRRSTHELARYARRRISQLTGLEPLAPDDMAWYGSMISLPLPPGDASALQEALWRERIEVPILDFREQRLLRVSCHVYNRPEEIDRLVEALTKLGIGGN